MGHDFHENYDLIRSMERRAEFEILGVTDKKIDQEYEYDGLRIIPPDYIQTISFDYLYVVSRAYFSDITDDLIAKWGVARSRILSFFLFTMPGMTLNLYEKLSAKRWSILCNNCFGGLLSHQFGLEHRSPLKNLFIMDSDLIKLAESIECYLAQEPVFDHWEQAKTVYDESRYPVLRLDDILLYCNHDTDPDVALAKYARGAAKIDPEALMVIMITSSAKVEHEFQKRSFGCPKLCISSAESHSPKTLYIESDSGLDLITKANAIPGDSAYFDILVNLLLGKEEFVY